MGQNQSERVKELFDRLRAMPLEQHDEVLSAMGESPEAEAVRAEVQVLLDAFSEAGGFLQSPTGGGAPTALRAAAAAPGLSGVGAQIGPYKLLQEIGEGGFGSVYMAEQDEPFRRRVALKIIKLGMDTRQVVARFEAERQALAMMDHPGIAKVFDAGATEHGRPYFVMELVRGVPITEFCERQHLSIPERLELFRAVCAAVQHAHQKGVIHRDLKPSNVLVTIADGRPVPKVIDFGIAKATQARLTEKTLFTEFRQMIGTPEYMSPEQAESNGIDIDTRTDVYSWVCCCTSCSPASRPSTPSGCDRRPTRNCSALFARKSRLTPAPVSVRWEPCRASRPAGVPSPPSWASSSAGSWTGSR